MFVGQWERPHRWDRTIYWHICSHERWAISKFNTHVTQSNWSFHLNAVRDFAVHLIRFRFCFLESMLWTPQTQHLQSQLTANASSVLGMEAKLKFCARQWPILIWFAKSNVNIYLYPIKAYVEFIHSTKFILHWRVEWLWLCVWQTIRKSANFNENSRNKMYTVLLQLCRFV